MTFFENLKFFLGFPKKAPADVECFKCHTKDSVIDLGDGGYICKSCWDNWIPGISAFLRK